MGVAVEDRLRGASVYEKRVFETLKAHQQEERDVIDGYEAMAEGTASMTVKYLVQMILEDERRHHRILGELMNTVRAHSTLEERGPRVPFVDVHGNRAQLAQARRFLAHERRERASLRRLARRVRFVGDELDAFVVDLLRLDTERHIRILRYLTRMLGTRPDPSIPEVAST